MADALIWQDRDIRFDVSKEEMKSIHGETVVFRSQSIEDAQGNVGENGNLEISNLRMIWYAKASPKINLSIGFGCIVSVEVKISYTSQTGNTQTLYIQAKYQTSRFEFIFRSLTGESPKIFAVFQNVARSYEATKLYRDIKTSGAIVFDQKLILLKEEQIMNEYTNVNSVGQEAPNKAGPSILVQALQSAGSYVVGYQGENIQNIVTEGQKLLKYYREHPNLGVDINADAYEKTEKERQIENQKDDVEIVDYGYNYQRVSAPGRYLAGAQNKGDEQIFFSPDLGLAIEKPPGNSQIEDLWKIINIK